MIRKATLREAVTPATHPSGEGWTLRGPSGIIAHRVELATTPWRRAVGLLGRGSFEPGLALVITPCSQVHTIGMRFPIDAVFCDAALTVLAWQTLEPGKLGRTVRGAKCCIELPAGTAQAHGIARGVVLRFEGPGPDPARA